MTKGNKKIRLAGGSEEGFNWELKISVYPLSHNFTGTFVLESALDKYKRQIRHKDRMWARRNLPASYRGLYEIHHNWQDGARVQLLTADRHRELHAGISASGD